MKTAKITALGSFKPTSGDLRGNSAKMQELCSQAAAADKKILLLPELSLTGSACQDLLFNQTFAEKCMAAVEDLAEKVPEGLLLGFGTALYDVEGQCRDAYVFVQDGAVQAVYCAKGFARTPTEYRQRSFTCTKDKAVFMLQGRVVVESHNGFELDGLKIAVVFTPGVDKQLKHADLIVLPSVRAYEVGGIAAAAEQALEISSCTRALTAAVNLCGNESADAVLDGVCIMARKGRLLMQSSPCFFNDVRLCSKEDGIAAPAHLYDEMLRAVALGLFDFMIKTHAKGFALSLSGGADSALCASSVAAAQLCALTDLGADSYIKTLRSVGLNVADYSGDPLSYVKNEVMPKLLTTVYQGSDNSSAVTREAAEQIAKAVGASHHVWSISKVVNDYVELYNSISAGHPLSWEHDDITLQNIQARARLPGIWMVANREGKLLIETSNLSESVVGYCTMDGDTAGGLAPIGGIGKSVVRRINAHLETEGFKVNDSITLKIPEMSYITKQQPTAELRPGGGQTDEGDLMPYAILDYIRRLFAQERLGPAEILARLQEDPEFKELDHSKFKQYVQRYFLLHARSQWKRERFPVGFHIEKDDASPKGYWRFPIFNGDLKVLTEDL